MKMKTPKIIPATYPDTMEDAQPGATFYASTPELEGVALLRMGSAFVGWSKGHAIGHNVVRLDNGEALRLLEETHIRITALSADTLDENW